MRILLSKKMLQKAHACAPVVIAMFLDNDTLAALLAALAGKKGCTGGILENFAYAFTGAGRAFQVVTGTDFLADSHTLIEM
jgi:hypothetical protein